MYLFTKFNFFRKIMFFKCQQKRLCTYSIGVVGLKNSRFPADDVHIVVVVAGLLMALVTPILHMCDEAKGLRSVLLLP